jgi:hypothetical protein
MGFDYIKSKLAFEYSETFAGLGANRDIHLKLPAQTANEAQTGFFGAWLFACGKLTAGTALLSLTEAIATAGDGTPIVLLNKNRLDTPMTSVVGAFHTPTTPTGGTQLQIAAGAVSEPAELCAWILKPGVNYLLRLAGTAASGTLGFKLKQIPNFDFLYKKEL